MKQLLPRIAFAVLIVISAPFFLLPILFASIVRYNPIAEFLDQWPYHNDKRTIFQIAEQLGYTETDQLGFYRAKSTMYQHDNSRLVFTTKDSSEDFEKRVQILSLRQEAFRRDNPSVNFEFSGLCLDIKDCYVNRLEYEIPKPVELIPIPDRSPHVYYWEFNSGSNKEIVVYYARLSIPAGYWKHKDGRIITDSVVVVELKR